MREREGGGREREHLDDFLPAPEIGREKEREREK